MELRVSEKHSRPLIISLSHEVSFPLMLSIYSLLLERHTTTTYMLKK
jgi:hypothetical protein